MELTDPLDAAVVNTAHVELAAIPNRDSFPSMLPPLCPSVASILTCPSAISCGVAFCSAMATPASASTSMIAIAAKMARPCRLSFNAFPKVKHNETGISRMEIISSIFEKGVGFSSGYAELVPKNPPPLVPSCLMATWLAAGPIGTVASVISSPSSARTGSRSRTVSYSFIF